MGESNPSHTKRGVTALAGGAAAFLGSLLEGTLLYVLYFGLLWDFMAQEEDILQTWNYYLFSPHGGDAFVHMAVGSLLASFFAAWLAWSWSEVRRDRLWLAVLGVAGSVPTGVVVNGVALLIVLLLLGPFPPTWLTRIPVLVGVIGSLVFLRVVWIRCKRPPVG
jgi:hypothetical protein